MKRATFWFAEGDLDAIARLQRVFDVPGLSGTPDKSAIVREAVRRLAAEYLADEA